MTPHNRKLAPKLSEPTYLLNHAMAKSIAKMLETLLPLGSQARVLDVGCGRMPYKSLFDGRCAEYVGCDAYPFDDSVVKCPADAMTFADGTFDLVVAFQVLEHTDHPWRVVNDCFRVTRPGGRCLLTAPFLFPHHASPHDYFRFSHEGLASLATDAGFVVDEVVPQCGSLQTVLMLLAWYNMIPTGLAQKLTRSATIGALYGATTTVPLNLLGRAAGAIPYGKTTKTNNLGFSNFMLVAHRPTPGA